MSENAVPSEREMLQARLHATHTGTAYGIFANFGAVAVAVVATLADTAEEVLPSLWGAFMVFAIGGRCVLHRAFANDHSLSVNPHWQRLVSLSALGIALGWSWFGVRLFPQIHGAHHLMLTMLVVIFVTAPLIAPFRTTSLAFLALTSVPVMKHLLVQDDPASSLIIGILVILFVVQWCTLEILLKEITKNLRLMSQQNWANVERMEHMRGVETANRLLAQALNEREVVAAQLKDAMRAAEQANRAKGDFLAYTSHEIRTPLNAIIGFTRAVLDTSLSKEQVDYLRRVRNAGVRLLSLINDLLDMSKIEAGKLEIQEQTFVLRDILQEVTQEQIVATREKGISIDSVIPDDVPNLLIGDPLRLGQILRNLLSNAVKFTDTGGVTVIVDLLDKTPQTCRLHFSVRDTGIGIPSEQQGILFQPYRQTSTGKSITYGGTGLGLAISKSLCELMSGTISVRSEFRKGSDFFFELPFKVPSQCTIDDVHRTTAISLAQRKVRVLVAEDNEDNQVLIELLLRRWGADVTIVENGELAVREAEARSFDVVLMDLEMPVMDGFQAVTVIRNGEKINGGHLFIAALSAHAVAGYRERCLSAGMDDYLTKPVDPDDLYGMLARVGERQAGVPGFVNQTNE